MPSPASRVSRSSSVESPVDRVRTTYRDALARNIAEAARRAPEPLPTSIYDVHLDPLRNPGAKD